MAYHERLLCIIIWHFFTHDLLHMFPGTFLCALLFNNIPKTKHVHYVNKEEATVINCYFRLLDLSLV